MHRVVEGRQTERREAEQLRAGLHGALALRQSDDASILRAVEALRDHEASLAESLDKQRREAEDLASQLADTRSIMTMKLKDNEEELNAVRKRNDDEREELLKEKLERERLSDEQLE